MGYDYLFNFWAMARHHLVNFSSAAQHIQISSIEGYVHHSPSAVGL